VNDKPYWFPVLTDAAWVARIREDYPDDTDGLSDESIRDQYADGCKYADTWDNLGDAREDYEKLADAYLAMLAAAPEPPAPGVGLDPVLAKFYDVDNVPALIAAQSEHIEKLQDAARRNVKPWEDTFPPTLLPKYLRDNGLPDPVPPTVVVVQTAKFCPACGEATGNPDCFICAATPPAPSAGVSVSEGAGMAWTDEDAAKPWGCEVAFLRHLANDPAIGTEKGAMLRHCAKRIEATAWATPSSPSAGEAVRWDEAQFEGEPIMRGAVCMAKWAGWENPQANAERYFNVVRDVLATAQPLFPTPAPVVAVSEGMVEAACMADWGEREWHEAGEPKRAAERIIMRSILTTAMRAGGGR
jgi:hypothetical protein